MHAFSDKNFFLIVMAKLVVKKMGKTGGMGEGGWQGKFVC